MGKRKQRNILMIVQNLPVPFDRRVWQEAISLRQAGFGVAVICPKKKMYTKGYELIDGIDVYRYPLIFEADENAAGYFIEFIYCWLASLALALLAYTRKPFHAIHACNPPDTYFAMALLFRVMGVKFVFDHHDLCPEMYVAKGRPRKGALYRGLIWLERCTLRSADLVIAVNRSHYQIALERGNIPAENLTIVRSGPRREWAKISDCRLMLKQGRQFLVVYLGEMCKQDGVEGLLRTIHHYKQDYGSLDTLFALIGGGPDQQRLRDAAAEMDLADITCFTGRVSDHELWSYLSTADVCVDPDPLSEWSNLSTMNKMIEYLSFGRPVVAFDLREHRNTASDCAVYVKPNDELLMSNAIRELLFDEQRRENMSRRGRQRFCELLAWEISESELIKAYCALLNFQPLKFSEDTNSTQV